MAAATKTVAVLGAAYGGPRAAQILAHGLPSGWRVVLIDRNSHMNHLYVLPRFAVLPGHERKAFIPYTNVFADARADPAIAPASENHIFLHASVTSLASKSLTLDRAFPEHGITEEAKTLHFDYLIYALGSHLPAPIDVWGPVLDDLERSDSVEDRELAQDLEAKLAVSENDVVDVTAAVKVVENVKGTKAAGIDWLKRFQKRIARARSVLVVGGGALGIQFASDIAEVHPNTAVTLLHSRARLLPRFAEEMHNEVISSLSALNVKTILGERLDVASVASPKVNAAGERVVRTTSGKEISAELVLLCTGQTPNTGLLRDAFPDSPSILVDEGEWKNSARIRRTMQLAEKIPSESLPPDVTELFSAADSDDEAEEVQEDRTTRVKAEHVFVIGDAADAFGAINAGHCAYAQGEVAARNVLHLIKGDSELEKYVPGPPAIKVSLGLARGVYQFQGMVGRRENEQDDMDAHLIWRYFGIEMGEGMD